MSTVVFVHAHPDDEASQSAGSMARAVSEGHRVVLVVATNGDHGDAPDDLAEGETVVQRRRVEAAASNAVIGTHRVEFLGYADSGMAGEPSGLARPFAAADPGEAAERLATVLRAERADVLTSYDPAGGYGHPDHVQVHRVGARAAALAGTPVLLEATVDRTALRRVLRLVSRLPGLPAGFDPRLVDRAYTPRAELTHRVDVRAFTGPKRAAMAAHASQATADQGTRTLQVLLRLPVPVFDLVAGHEWFRQPGRVPPRRLLDDVFAGLYG
jgi:LmbE family N-acetylglucosaminyl deacetylase